MALSGRKRSVMYRLRQGSGGDDGVIGNADAVMDLVFFLETAEDGDRVFDRRFGDENGLEAAREGGIFLDMFAVLIQRRRADHVQFAARKSRLEHIAGIHRAFGLTRADQRMELIEEQV
jgi:hypothetical protein